MVLKRSTQLVAFFLCSLFIWCKLASAGSSFLSPSHKPQMRGKSSRVGRQITEEPTGDNSFQISAPFEVSFTLDGQDLEDYGAIIQRIIKNLLGETPPLKSNSG